MKHRIALLAIIALAAAPMASAQLIVTSQGPTALAVAIQGEGGFDYEPSAIPVSFTVAGLTFTAVANPLDFTVGGGITVDLSYIGKESAHTNWMGVAGGSTDTALYAPYSASSSSVGYGFDALWPTSVSFAFWHSDHSDDPTKVWQSDPSAARFWMHDEGNGTVDYILGWEDRYPHIDKDDGTFLVQVYTPVPEPSTYGLIGAASLLGLAAWRRSRRRACASASGSM